MKKRATRRSSVTIASPVPEEKESPALKSAILNKNKISMAKGFSASVLFDLQSSPPNSHNQKSEKSLTSISDLKNFASSRLEDVKRNLIDRSHSEILKDLDASHSRIHKRSKIQAQSCQQMMDEAEKEYNKISERIHGFQEEMKASYVELMDEAQSTASVCKTSISELSKSFEKAIGDLHSRYGVVSP